MVEMNENSVNTTENETEMTTTKGQIIKEDLSTKNDNNNDHTKILHSVSIDKLNNEYKRLSSKRIIQIIGGGNSIKQKNKNEAENSKLINNNVIIHEIDATSEDPFTLESFDVLIQQHAEKNKDFIIAKVTTVDPSDELKTYHSYYSGHHINKVLFRTQPDQGLLHRMKAKNPLNNMNIIGDVHYYVVKASSIKKLPTFAKSSSMSITSKRTLRVKGEEDTTIMATSSLDKTEEKDFLKFNIKNIENIMSRRSAPPSIWNFESNDDDDDDDDDDEKFAIEMEPSKYNKRWSANDSLKPLPKAFTINHSFSNHNSSTSDGKNLEILLSTLKLQNFDNYNNDDNNESQSSKIIKNNFSSSPPPENNEISISIPDNNDNSSLKEQQQDDLSPIITQSSTKESQSIISNEEIKGDGSICYKAIFYATDDDFLMHSTIRQFFKSNALDPMDAQLFTINTFPNNNNSTTPPSTRLERMVTNHGTYLVDPMVIGNARSPLNMGNMESSESNNVPTSRWRRVLYNMRMNKGLRWLVLMYMIFGFLLIRFVVSETYAYLMAFLLMLCLFLVFCVGSGVGIWGR
ncbi:hypothetical protein C1645_871478 [Glomus cerebriforme]|uniref:Uncharacterized protein n=1 Tax=Glomus cerebriforme TaxID=658196 RepID=A0A397TL75_9GLOM|nr:hypothetical protein C1645_871478 [Glomus cerebriforme]